MPALTTFFMGREMICRISNKGGNPNGSEGAYTSDAINAEETHSLPVVFPPM